MKTLLATRYVSIPEDVTLEVKSRVVTVTGPRGELVQSFKHVNLDLQKTAGKLRVDLWFGTRKQVRVGFLGDLINTGVLVVHWFVGWQVGSSRSFKSAQKKRKVAVNLWLCSLAHTDVRVGLRKREKRELSVWTNGVFCPLLFFLRVYSARIAMGICNHVLHVRRRL